MTNVAILGASNNPARYSFMAQRLLQEHQHRVYPVTIHGNDIEGVASYLSLDAIPDPIDTVTVYLSPENLTPCIDQVIRLKPRRVIFNPGSENTIAEKAFEDAGIFTERACTLVLLRTNQF
jgi:predicted CoA-binding protein